MKKALKKKSKRVPTRQRVKAEKKVREHNRKIRKEKRKNPAKFQKQMRKNLAVPNDCPFKEAVLQEVEEARKRKEVEKAARRAKIAERAANMKAGQRVALEGGLEGVVEKSEQRANEFEEKMEEDSEQNELNSNQSQEKSAKSYYKEFSKVVEAADVVLQVLDARDPLGTRCEEVENMVLSQGKGKRVVLVLNKADLVPKENLQAWLKYLRLQLPTIAFKSSTQTQAKRLGHDSRKMTKLTDEQLVQTSKCVGVNTLMTLLGNYCRVKDIKSAIKVGVVGYPNVGKSSLINSLKRGKVCGTGNTPGVTKVMQEVKLDKKISLLDCPGMVLNSKKSDDVQVALRNAMKCEQITDFVSPISAILERCQKDYMQLQYTIPSFDNVNEFLGLVAREKGKLKKGGVPDIEAAAKIILSDWNSGKIKYYTHPPETKTLDVDSQIVNEYAKEFNLDDLKEQMETDESELPDVLPSETTLFDSSSKVEEIEKLAKVSVQKPAVPRKSNIKLASVVNELGPNAPPKLRKAQKLREKKERKEKNRKNRVGDELSDIMNAAL